MSGDDGFDYSIGLVAVSLLLLFVPLFDMWQDISAGKPPLSTLFENSVFLALILGFLGASVWLLRNDWDEASVQIVARWSMLGTGVVAAVYAWVLGFQLFAQNDPKPVIIAADGIVIGGITLFVAGVYNARSQRERAALQSQRDQFSALFDNTSDAIAVVSDGDTPVFEDVNDPFERTFGRERSDVVGRPVPESLSALSLDEDTGTREHESASERSIATLVGEPDAQLEVHRQTATGRQDFLVEYVPVGDGSEEAVGFLVFTEITAQKQRERQFETLSEGSEGLLRSRSSDDIVTVVRDIGTDLFDLQLIGIWADHGGTLVPVVSDTNDAVDLPSVTVQSDRGSVGDIDADHLREAVAEHGTAVDHLLVRQLDDQHVLVLGRHGSEFSATDRYLADVLAANARTASERVDRERTLTQRNDQLEFVNSLLRHDIQNAMTIIRSRGQVLAESVSGQEAEYAETIVEQSDEITDLIDRFRALLDALTDSDTTALEPVSLSSVLRQRVDTLERTFERVDVSVTIPDGVDVVADEMLTNVLGNVMQNAVEHNDTDDPSLDISVEQNEATVEVRVADNGPGIPDEKKDVIFRRGDRGLKESDIGSGFGLFFVDAMMDRYGGKVSVEDNDPRGSVFVLTFQTAG